MEPTFVHLRLHTEYSLVDGLVRIGPLVAAVREQGMPAVAVTEYGNLFSIVKFYRAARAAGIKPVVGVDFLVHNRLDPNHPSRMLLLCKSTSGYRQLAQLVSRTYTDAEVRGHPILHTHWLSPNCSDELIALSGGIGGEIGQALSAGKFDAANRCLAEWQARFPDRFYLEVERTGREGEEAYIDACLELAGARRCPVVATNDVRFLDEGDFEAHEARVCIHDSRVLDDPRRPRTYSPQQYLRSAAEMCQLFADVPEAIENSVEIARRCTLELELGVTYLPAFPVPPEQDISGWFEQQSRNGLEGRIGDRSKSSDHDDAHWGRYRERLQTELDVIISMGFSGYFLIVADFINWAKENGVPVGPGRGSGAGSLVAYALGITELDPIEYDLLFERFLNPERVSLPDFDIDFCMEGRDRVINYVTERYGGRDYVSQIITFGTMAAKAVVRDVGRVLGYPYGFVDQIAKLVPFEVGMTLERALEQEELLQARYRDEDDVRNLIDLARKLEGLARNAGRHAGGVVIAPSPLTDFTALYCERGATGVVTQLDKDDVESIGLVKFDFLGLRTLTIIDWAVRAINRGRAHRGEAPLDINTIPLDDAPTYELIRKGQTTAVFQLESRAMKDLIRRLQPVCFDDLIALNALIRPGPSQLADDFIDRKHGRSVVTYLHPELEPVLKPTYGVILYQEQVMQIAQVLAGYTLGEADLLRRAMGKKKPQEMAKQRKVFVNGAQARGVDIDASSYIFDLMEKFAGYGFNKSHSAAYALIAYQTAWLKTHYPADFMAAVLSADLDNTDKVVTLIDECRDMALDVLPPDVNQCAYHFAAERESGVRYGLGAIKGVGQGAIQGVFEEREQTGPFVDLFDFCRRVDTSKVNRRVIEALIRSGALDVLGPSRAALIASLSRALQAADQYTRNRSTGQNDLFGGLRPESDCDCHVDAVSEWSEEDRLAGEKDTLGLYLTGHPIKQFEAEIAQFTDGRLVDLRPNPGSTVVVAGLVVSARVMNSRRGRMAVITLDDQSARMEAVVYSDVFQRYRDLLAKDRLLIAAGEVTPDEVTGGCSMTVHEVHDLEKARERYAKRVLISVLGPSLDNGFISELRAALEPFRLGPTPVCIQYRGGGAVGRLQLGEDWKVHPAQDLLNRLRGLREAQGVEINYS